MRIVGLGVDLADIDRVERIFEKYPKFAERCFTDHEQEYAMRFAKPAATSGCPVRRQRGRDEVDGHWLATSPMARYRDHRGWETHGAAVRHC